MTLIRLSHEEEMRLLREQVTNLQAQLTALELDNRKLKWLYAHSRNLLQHVLIDNPLITRLYVCDGVEITEPERVKGFLNSIVEVLQRVERLEDDAGTQTTWLVRQMVEKAKSLPFKIDSYGEFVWQHVNQFKQILGIDDGGGKENP